MKACVGSGKNLQLDGMQLTYQKVPTYAWNELVAEELFYDAMAIDPNFAAYTPLLAANSAAQIMEVDRRLALAAERVSESTR